MSAEPILAIGDLAVEFPLLSGTVEAVRGCSLSIGKGEVMALVGESGCGKSMLALACLGLVPKPGIVRGSVQVAGREVVGRTDRELADLRGGRAAMIFQNPASALNPFFTVGTQLGEVVARHRGLSRAAARQAVIAALEDVRLPDPEIALGKYPHQMSGGQLQRVMIAMAVACRPVLLIADEPTTALDVTIQAQIIVLLRDLVERTDLSVLFITHDLGVVAEFCDRVAVMYAGAIVERGPVVDFLEEPLHPYARMLLAAVPRLGAGRARLEAISGQVPNLAHLPQGCPFHPRCAKTSDVCRRDDPVMRRAARGRHVACHHALGAIDGGVTGDSEDAA